MLHSFSVAIMGSTGVGKSALICRCLDSSESAGELMESRPTVGVDTSKLIKMNCYEQRVNLRMFDISGADTFVTLSAGFLRKANAVIIVYDVSDENSLDKAEMRFREAENLLDPDEVTFILVANKIDLPTRVVTPEMGWAKAEQLKLDYFETSAADDINVDAIFNHVTNRLIMKKLRQTNFQLFRDIVINDVPF